MNLSQRQFVFLVMVGLLSATAFMAVNAAGNNSDGTCPAPSPANSDPNAYPTLQMARYQFIRLNYRLLRMVADFYFLIVNALFDLWNAFQPVGHVSWNHNNNTHLLFIPASKAAELIRQGNLKSRDLVQAYVDRMREVNDTINALHHDNGTGALALAEQYDNQLAAMTSNQRDELALTRPLFGVPISIKANLWVKGLVTSACNIYLMNGTASDKNAPIVQRAFDAGAIMLGITTMPNGGLSWFGDDSGCGQVKNPHDTRRTSGGSSSGEGTLIASGGSLFGYGNDIGGSVRNPGNMNGVFGLKPTNYPDHTVPVEGIEPNFIAYEPAKQQLTNGPLVRYADDLPLILSMMAGKNQSEYVRKVNFTKKFKLYYLEDIEIMLGESLHEEQRNSVRKVKKYFEEKYGLNVLKLELPLFNRLNEFWGLTGWSNGNMTIPEALSHFPEVYKGVSNETFLSLYFYMLKDFTLPKDGKEREFVYGKLEKLRKQINDTLGSDGVLLLPALPTPQPWHHMEPFVNFNLYYVQIFNMLGHPAITVPTGKSAITNMPLGVQFAAGPYNEALLIAVAREMEKAFGGWVMPGEVPQAVLDEAKLAYSQ